MEICKQQSELEMRHLPASQYMVMWAVTNLSVMGESIGIDETNKFQLKFVSLWALEWAWYYAETNLRCVSY